MTRAARLLASCFLPVSLTLDRPISTSGGLIVGVLLLAGLVAWLLWRRMKSAVRDTEARAALEAERLSRVAAEAQARDAETQAALEREQADRQAAEARVRSAEAIAQAAEISAQVLDGATHALFAVDLDGRVTLVNRCTCSMTGRPAEALIGLPVEEMFAPDCRIEVEARRRVALATGAPVSLRGAEFLRGDGQTVPVRSNFAPLRRGDQVVGLVGTAEDNRERRATEIQLSRMAAVIEQSSESILITDLDEQIVYVNPAFERASGYRARDLLGRDFRIVRSEAGGGAPRDMDRALSRSVRSGGTWQGIIIGRRSDGLLYPERATVFPIRDRSGRIINFASVTRDITQEQKLEEQLLQSQKLEAIGQLAGGIAHDFNNILTVINGYAGLALLTLPHETPLWRHLSEIKREGARAANLTRQLLAFSRKQRIEPRRLELNDLLLDLQQLLSRLIGENTELRVEPGGPALVLADPTQLEQVFVNLVVNARDALDESGTRERHISITTELVDLDAETVSRLHGSTVGPHVQIEVADTGSGMSEDVISKIFEPFFTTKPVGQGTGLGLATVYGIVKQNGGSIFVDSEPGVGTTFRIYWPRQARPIALGDPARPEGVGDSVLAATPIPLPQGRGETVLLVEDEAAVRGFAVLTLRALGYTVVEAADGREALEWVEQADGPLDLIFTDLIMPHLGGRKLVEAVRPIRPGARVLLCTGYTDPPDRAESGGAKWPQLQKPYSPEQLAFRIRDVLDGPPMGGLIPAPPPEAAP